MSMYACVCVCVFKFFSEITRPLAKFHAEPPWKKVYSNDSGHLLFFILILSGTFSMAFQFLFIAFLLLSHFSGIITINICRQYVPCEGNSSYEFYIFR